MENKTCATCTENDGGLCDLKGILVEDDDTCERWSNKQADWKEHMLHEAEEQRTTGRRGWGDDYKRCARKLEFQILSYRNIIRFLTIKASATLS